MNNIILIYNHTHMSLGHEIHISRIILLDLLCKKFIKDTDYIVTTHDRKFLYDKIFTNVIENHEYDEMNKNNFTIIDLRPYADTIKRDEIPELVSINYKLRYNNYYTDEFIKICLNINFYNDETINKFGFNFINNEQYIMIHHRYNASIDILINFLNTFKKIKPQIKIIIFNSLPNDLKISLIEYNNIYIIDDLRLYTSLLHYSNCKLLIGEWSGGTQLAQYCFNGIILYYFNTYDSYIYIDIYKDLIKSSKNDIFDGWDFKNFTNSTIYMYKNADDLINSINLYI